MKSNTEYRAIYPLLGIIAVISMYISYTRGDMYNGVMLNYLYIFIIGLIEERRIRTFLRVNSASEDIINLITGIEQRKIYREYIKNSAESTVITRGLETYLRWIKILLASAILNFFLAVFFI